MPSKRFYEYLDQCKIFHKENKTFSGNGCIKHVEAIISLAEAVGAKTALDYGCGKGNQYSRLVDWNGERWPLEDHLGFLVDKFDPAVKKFASTPLDHPRDLVWCTDVMEHIPEEDIDFIVSELSRLSAKALFVTVGTYPAKKTLPNGENAHVTIKPLEWWEERFAPVAKRTDIKFQMQVG